MPTRPKAAPARPCGEGATTVPGLVVYRFNAPVMRQMLRSPRNTWQLEQAVISMLAGDLFDPPPVLLRLRVFKIVYAVTVLRNLRQWWAGHRYRLAQARAE